MEKPPLSGCVISCGRDRHFPGWSSDPGKLLRNHDRRVAGFPGCSRTIGKPVGSRALNAPAAPILGKVIGK